MRPDLLLCTSLPPHLVPAFRIFLIACIYDTQLKLGICRKRKQGRSQINSYSWFWAVVLNASVLLDLICISQFIDPARTFEYIKGTMFERGYLKPGKTTHGCVGAIKDNQVTKNKKIVE